MNEAGARVGAVGAVVVGGGHNGLICAAYLAKAGISTLVVEARDTVGGCASTESALGGARVNICNCDHAMVRTTPIAEELDLARHGLRYVDAEPSFLLESWQGGPSWFFFHDIERTIESLRLAHPGEVDAYRRYLRAALPAARLVTEIGQGMPTPGTVARSSLRQFGTTTRAVPTLLQWANRSVGDVIRSFFTAPQVQGPLMTTGPSVWGVGPDTPGTGLGALGYALRHVAQVGRPIGGSGALTDAVAASLIEAGGAIRTGTRVTSIVCEGDAVRGVRVRSVADGTRADGLRADGLRADDAGDELIEAPIVIIATDPRRAFVEWLRDPPPAAHALVERYRSTPPHDGYESKVDAVVSERYRSAGIVDAHLAALGLSLDDARSPTMVVSSSLEAIAADHVLAQRGVIGERPQYLVQMPSVLDPSVAAGVPSGHDVFSLEVLWTPYALDGGWAGSDEPMRWVRRLDDLLTTESGRPFHETLTAWRHMGPLEYESQFSMHRGHAPSFAGTPITALLGRNPEQTRYETPVRGLFLTGAATFPGAGIWGAPGRNAATAVLGS